MKFNELSKKEFVQDVYEISVEFHDPKAKPFSQLTESEKDKIWDDFTNAKKAERCKCCGK